MTFRCITDPAGGVVPFWRARTPLLTNLSQICGYGCGNISRVAGTAWLILCCLLTLTQSGCSEKKKKPPGENSVAFSQTSQAEESRRKLSAAIQRIRPESMATQTRREMVVNSLNAWLSTSAEQDVEKLRISAENSRLLSQAAVRSSSSVRFTENDIVYIRDCLLLKALTESLWKQSDESSAGTRTSDTERVVRVFQHLIRNISLMPADETRVPLGLYEVLLTGRGTVNDRIWAFAEAMRQRSLDVVVLIAGTPGEADSSEIGAAADILIGVSVDRKCLLFDPSRGTAVPRAEDTQALVTLPATVEQIAGMERWRNGAVRMVCHPSAVAPRMLVLQESLEASDSAVLYEELVGGTSEIRPLVQRLSDVLGTIWPTDDLRIWDVPEKRIAESVALSEGQKVQFDLLMRPLESPFERETIRVDALISDPNINEDELSTEQKAELKMAALAKQMERSDDLFGKASRRLLATRVRQIMGHVDVGMIQDLQQIRIASMQEQIELEVPMNAKQAMVIPFPLPKSIIDIQRSALGDTLYWTAMVQLSRHDYGAAIATLRSYRRQYPDEKHVFASVCNEAEAMLATGNTRNLESLLSQSDVDANPERHRVRWLLSRVRTVTGGDKSANGSLESLPAEQESLESL